MADFLPDIVVAALINTVCTAAVFFASRRKLILGALLAAAVLLTYLAVLWFFLGGSTDPHSVGELLGTELATVAVVWCPGAILALIAGRLHDRMRRALGVVSVLAGLLLGAGYIFVALEFSCRFLRECL
jgi:hypothetical protein